MNHLWQHRARLAAVGVIALAGGCGTGSAPKSAHPPTTVHKAPGPATSTGSRSSSGATPTDASAKAFAQAEVTRLLRTFTAGVGWRQVTGLSTPGLAESAGTAADFAPTLVQGSQFWIAPGNQSDVLAYLRAHQPAGSVSGGNGRTSGPHMAPIDQLVFRFGDTPPGEANGAHLPPLIGSEALYESVTADAQGRVDIRVDVQVLWRPPRTPAQLIPAGITSVRIIARSDDTGPAPIHDVTITDPTQTAKLRTITNNLVPVIPVGENPGGLMISGADVSWRVDFRIGTAVADVLATSYTPNGEQATIAKDARTIGPVLGTTTELSDLLVQLAGPLPAPHS